LGPPPDLTGQAVALIIGKIGGFDSGNKVRRSLVDAIEGLASGLTGEQAVQTVPLISAAVEKSTDQPRLEALADALAAVAPAFKNDDAVAVLVFELLKFPWTPVTPLARVLKDRSGQETEQEASLQSFIASGRAQFQDLMDFESAPQSSSQINAIVNRVL